MAKQPHYCSFCGKSEREVSHLVAGPTMFICDECVTLCQGIIDDRMAQAGAVVEHEPTKTRQMKDWLVDLRSRKQK